MRRTTAKQVAALADEAVQLLRQGKTIRQLAKHFHMLESVFEEVKAKPHLFPTLGDALAGRFYATPAPDPRAARRSSPYVAADRRRRAQTGSSGPDVASVAVDIPSGFQDVDDDDALAAVDFRRDAYNAVKARIVVECIETGVRYRSARAAALAIGREESAVSAALRRNGAVAGLHFRIVGRTKRGYVNRLPE